MEDGTGGWPAKLVETEFMYEGRKYSIKPKDIGLDGADGWEQGFMECLQNDMAADLEKAGAEEILNIGFLD